MKPREFDDLVRQKFDQNDFAYNPKNWDQLAEQLEGRAKKRSMLMWLWMPAAGMAASVALAIGVTTMFRFGTPDAGSTRAEYAQTKIFAQSQPEIHPIAMVPFTTPALDAVPSKTNTRHRQAEMMQVAIPAGSGIGLKLENIVGDDNGIASAVVPHSSAPENMTVPKVTKKNAERHKVYRTFRDDVAVVRKPLNLSVILSGGISQGSRNSGYMAGATVRKMINDKVYIESDVAVTSSDNTQRTLYMSYDNPAAGGGAGSGSGATAAKPGSASKTTTIEGSKGITDNSPSGTLKYQDIAYNLYYAQVSPAVGYKVMKRMSVGMGPDFQKLLIDNRPATSDVDRGNLQIAPSFDVGFIGKTEYALTQRVKAAVSYRKGINGVINPSDKYFDRDYIQFQMRCTIFNR